MTSFDRSFFERYLAAWSAGDIDAMMTWFTDDIDFRDMTMKHGARGSEKMRRFVEASFASFPDGRFRLDSHVCDGDTFAMEWTMQPGDIPGVSFGRVVDGRIAEQRDYWDGRLIP
ncbi:MAG: nuclear transport factor 2 family protein [Ilumatobacteraceae bacterium]|jgi:hypothetical protein